MVDTKESPMQGTPIDPADIVKLNVPNYTHGRLVEGAKDWLLLSGQIGVRPDGTWSDSFEDQANQTYTNINACLRDAGMTLADVVFTRIYMTHREDLEIFRKVRSAHLGDARIPSTMLFISGLAHPDWRIEVEIIASRG
jgi:2-iminobutanoate/2-iminopropanoate deaminase